MFLCDFFVLNEMSFVIKGEEYCLRRTGEANGTLESSSQSTCLLHGRFNVKIILFELVARGFCFIILFIVYSATVSTVQHISLVKSIIILSKLPLQLKTN